MNEELLGELAEAMKRREKAQAAIARWTEQLNDAVEDIKELSARITEQAADTEPELEEEPEPVPAPATTNNEYDPYAPRIFEPVTE